MPVCEPVCEDLDVTPPGTIATLTGTLGNNGWYVSDVQLILTATDDIGGSGVREIHYTVDGIENIAQGSSASHSIAGDGTHVVVRNRPFRECVDAVSGDEHQYRQNTSVEGFSICRPIDTLAA
jgi:hypothetical protein